MNALELAEECKDGYPLAPDAIAAAKMLRLQHEAIRVLREALITYQKAGVGNSTDYATQHTACMSGHKALKDTEEFQ